VRRNCAHIPPLLLVDFPRPLQWTGFPGWRRNRSELWLLDHTKRCLFYGFPHGYRRWWSWRTLDIRLVGRAWPSFVPTGRSKSIWGGPSSFGGTWRHEGKKQRAYLRHSPFLYITCPHQFSIIEIPHILFLWTCPIPPNSSHPTFLIHTPSITRSQWAPSPKKHEAHSV
jgi:hypothetical protein